MKLYEIIDVHEEDGYYRYDTTFIGACFFAADDCVRPTRGISGYVGTWDRVAMDRPRHEGGEDWEWEVSCFYAIKVKEII